MNDTTKPTRTRNALTLEQFYLLCEWLKRSAGHELMVSIDEMARHAREAISFDVTTANLQKAIDVTGVKPAFVTEAARKAAEAAKTARAEKAGPMFLDVLRRISSWEADTSSSDITEVSDLAEQAIKDAGLE
jgi:hypothetical protein